MNFITAGDLTGIMETWYEFANSYHSLIANFFLFHTKNTVFQTLVFVSLDQIFYRSTI